MDKFYSLTIIFSTAFTAKAQIPVPASPATGNASSCTTTPNIDVCPLSGNTVAGTHRNGVYKRGNTANNRNNIVTVSNLDKLNPCLYFFTNNQ